MTHDARKIVNALLEDGEEKKDEKPKKKLPDWLAKIKGEKTSDDDGGDKGGESSSSGGGGSSGAKGVGTPSSGETVKKTW